MALWLEHRDDKGVLIEGARFFNSSVTLIDQEPMALKEAVALAKPSAHLPVDKRDWALRIVVDDVH
jgi:hypothetical protein